MRNTVGEICAGVCCGLFADFALEEGRFSMLLVRVSGQSGTVIPLRSNFGGTKIVSRKLSRMDCVADIIVTYGTQQVICIKSSRKRARNHACDMCEPGRGFLRDRRRVHAFENGRISGHLATPTRGRSIRALPSAGQAVQRALGRLHSRQGKPSPHQKHQAISKAALESRP